MKIDHSTQPKQSTSVGVVVARVLWMLIGPLSLTSVAITIMETGHGWFAIRSILFLIALAVTIVARWVDPVTSEGEPTTPGQRRFTAAWTLIAGLIGWTVANVIGMNWTIT
jgi:hypothetical protein